MKRFLIPIAALFLAGGAIAQQDMSVDEAFVRTGLQGDAYEILSSELALERAESEDIREFAQQMIDAHTATSDRLQEMSGNLGYNAEFLASPAGGIKLAYLGQLEGAEFEHEYLIQQMHAHQAALAVYQIGANMAEEDELQQFASQTAGEVANHLGRIQELMETHGVSDPFSVEAIATMSTDMGETTAPAEGEEPAGEEQQQEEEQPAEEEPVEEEPTEEQPADEEPTDEEPATEEPTDEEQPEGENNEG